MSELRITLHGAVKNADDYRAAADKLLAAVRSDEPDTTVYDWYLSADGSKCLNVDAYASSEAFLAHFGAAQESGRLDAYMDAVDVERVEVAGTPTPEARQVLDGFGAIYLEKVASL